MTRTIPKRALDRAVLRPVAASVLIAPNIEGPNPRFTLPVDGSGNNDCESKNYRAHYDCECRILIVFDFLSQRKRGKFIHQEKSKCKDQNTQHRIDNSG